MPIYVHVPQVHSTHPRGSGWMECLSVSEGIGPASSFTLNGGGQIRRAPTFSMRILPGPPSTGLYQLMQTGSMIPRMTVRYEPRKGRSLQFVLAGALVQSIHRNTFPVYPHLPSEEITFTYQRRIEMKWEGRGAGEAWPTAPGWSPSLPGAPA